MTSTQLTLYKVLLFLVCLAIPWTSALAQSDEAYIQYRQKVMKSLGTHISAIGDIVKHKLPHQKDIATHGKAMQLASTLIESAYKKEITAGKTDAKPEIWQEWDKYIAAAKKLEDESRKLAEVAESGDMAAIKAMVKQVGESCGGCHQPYRKSKEESYKQR